MILRPYQADLITKTRALMQKGHRSILIQSPTGSGKTLLTAHMVGTCVAKGMRAWFTVHRHELLMQSSRAFQQLNIRHGIIAPEFPQQFQAPVQIASIQTLARRHSRFSRPKLIVIDECHHIAAKSWAKLFDQYKDAFFIGLTATPERLDGKGLGQWFSDMVEGPKVSWLIENKFLSKYKLYAPSHVNLDGVHKAMGDYVRSELSTAVDKPRITGDAIHHYKKFAHGKRAIVFAVSVEHSKHIAEQFQKEGFHAAHVDGDTPRMEREDSIARFAAGNIQVLSNVDLFGEGFDIPAMEAAILLRPTQSLGLYLQQVGRALRPSEGKETAIILDHVGNCERFGLPDQEREWSLEGRGDGGGDTQAPVRICKECFAAFPPQPRCPFCGFIFPIEPRTVEQVAGELQEVNQAQLALKLRWKRQQGQAQGFAELVALGQARGYKKPHAWASMVLKARQAKKLSEFDDFSKWKKAHGFNDEGAS
jgi:DNA repair protein RadD